MYFIDIIQSESVRLTRLLDEILDIGVLERGDEMPVSIIDPQLSLARAIDACRGLATTAQIHLIENYECADARVKANQDRLTQVFINILSNAIKYNDASSPRIEIVAATGSDTYQVIISDNGSGISKTDRSRIFEKFSRGSNTVNEKGAGLGLAISRTIVRKFGGDVSLLPGPMTRFMVSLPTAISHRNRD